MTKTCRISIQKVMYGRTLDVMTSLEEFSETTEYIRHRVSKCDGKILNEENTKSALILPILNMMGYNMIEDIEPEYNICSGRIDYYIGNIAGSRKSIVVECKRLNQQLGAGEGLVQLERYTREVEPTVSILTNGKMYEFYILTNRHLELIFTFNILNYSVKDLRRLMNYSKDGIMDVREREKLFNGVCTIEQLARDIKNEIKYELMESLKFSLMTSTMYSGSEIISKIQTLLGERDNSIKIDGPVSIKSGMELNVYDLVKRIRAYKSLEVGSKELEFSIYYDGMTATLHKGSKISGRCTYFGNEVLENKMSGAVDNYRLSWDITEILLSDAINIIFGVRDGRIPSELDSIVRKDMYSSEYSERYVFQSLNSIVTFENHVKAVLKAVEQMD